MKIIGISTLVLGLFGVIFSVNMDSTYNGVHNIGLLSQKQNFLLISLVLAIVGTGILIFRTKNERGAISASEDRASPENELTRPCPFCAEQIKAAAIICRLCNRDVEPAVVNGEVRGTVRQLEESPKGHEAARHIAQIEKFFTRIYIRVSSGIFQTFCKNFAIVTSEAVGKKLIVLGIFSLVLGALFLVYFVILDKTRDGDVIFYRLKECVAMILAGAVIIWCSRPTKQTPIGPNEIGRDPIFSEDLNQTSGLVHKVFIFPVDLMVVGICLVTLTWLLHNYNFLGIAYATALVSLGFAVYIKVYANKKAGYILAILASSYLLYKHIWFNEMFFALDRLGESLRGDRAVSIGPYLAILIISAAVPHTRLIRLGRLKFGASRGDFVLTIWRHEIFLPLISALIACVIIFGLESSIRNLYHFVSSLSYR